MIPAVAGTTPQSIINPTARPFAVTLNNCVLRFSKSSRVFARVAKVFANSPPYFLFSISNLPSNLNIFESILVETKSTASSKLNFLSVINLTIFKKTISTSFILLSITSLMASTTERPDSNANTIT